MSCMRSAFLLTAISLFLNFFLFCGSKSTVSGPGQGEKINDPVVIDTSDTSVDKPDESQQPVVVEPVTVPGRFGIVRLEGGMEKKRAGQAAITADSVFFSLGDLKATASYFFLLTNAGGRPITDISLSSSRADFIVEPRSIGSLEPSTSAALLPIVKITAVHGLAASGIGRTALMPQGKNDATVTITGITTDSSGNAMDVRMNVAISVEARVMDIEVHDKNGVIDLTKPDGSAASLFITKTCGLGWVLTYNAEESLTVKNTGNVTIVVRSMAGDALSEIDASKEIRDTVFPGESKPIDASKVLTTNNLLLLEFNGENTVADHLKIQQAPNGNGYLQIGLVRSSSSCPIDKPFRCKDGTCVTNESECPGSSSGTSHPACTADKPFKCPDGTCARDSTACKSGVQCPPETPIRCPDGPCVKDPADCPK